MPPANKKYVIVDVLSKKQLMVGKELCAFPKEHVDLHLQKSDQPNENWSFMKCKVIHELDSLQSAKDLLVALQILESKRKNTSMDENTLPLNTEKPKRGIMKRKEDFLYNSVDMDVAEMQSRNVPVQYPKFRVFEKLTSPIANSTQLETSPSTSECKHVGGAIVDNERLYTLVLNMSSAISELTKTINNMSSAITDLNVNVNQLLSNFRESEKPHQFDCGLSSQQFPLSSEEELQMLDTGLSQKETRDRFMAMVTRLSSDDPKASMRFVLSYLLTPEVASKFTLLSTSSKRALQKCTFYGCIRSALTHRFLSSSVNEKDLGKLYDIATQGYFHDIRDKMIKRSRRKDNQLQSTILTNITIIVYKNELAIALDMHNNRCLSLCYTVVQL
ncbi:unnamed protein product [Schistosoma margrebowiei]|uniref:DUF4806 domain-containing protein n=4 Tax=Schistosoma margrebowiei TaxID=48269 RepID=A0AA85AI42_9TREM|nr:unnamed protein product [Schistosoma margrebowiei]